MKKLRIFAVMLLLATLLVGCSGGDETIESGNFKLLSSFDKASFDMFYGGGLYEQSHADDEVTYVNSSELVAPADWEGYLKLLDSEKPDVIAISSLFDYYKLVSSGLLLDMNSLTRKEKLDLNAIQPSVLSLLKYPGEPNELYGLSPFFDPSALYYNKSMFDKYGIPLPKDGMTWGDMLQLASRFPNKADDGRQIYGYHHREFSTPGYYLDYFSSIEGLSLFEGNRLTLDKAEWRPLLERLIQAFSTQSMSFAANDGEVRMGDTEANGETPFLEGRVAMFSAPAALMEKLDQNNAPFEWGVVSQTVSLDHRKSWPYYPSPIYAIYRDARNTDAAWRYVHYMNETPTLKLLSKSVPQLSSHTDVGTERYGRSLQPFYETKVVPPSMAALETPSLIPPFFLSQTLNPIINREVAAALDGQKSLEEILQSIQQEGQAAFDLVLFEAE
ncbi:ABC transporter substrate-binding protein [Cohnella sp. WQ 127256]|uniref:ABC transporter substrate-binding protein n=1 Tax=Cohnella sp. WQ 127256 TaxID=2938790 RepID=UPI002118C024|nr:extracellular solute-binding protein [Cohnella sp. WQ 127256]